MTPSISILGGTGSLGKGLAARLSRAGLNVAIGSRDSDRAIQAAAEVQSEGSVTGHSNTDAAAAGDIVFLCVPYSSQAGTLKDVKDSLRDGTILVDATVPLATNIGGPPTRTLGVWQGSAAQQANSLVPKGVTVVAGLHTVSADLLGDLEHDLDEDTLLCSNDRDAIATVSEILAVIPGLRCVDAGRLELARVTEQMTALMISINIRHKAKTGVRVTGLPSSDS
ncbi:MAG: NADPH-dependent F420 reductase [Actinomycetes bacterium]